MRKSQKYNFIDFCQFAKSLIANRLSHLKLAKYLQKSISKSLKYFPA